MRRFPLLATLLALIPATLPAQMVSPTIDQHPGPFSYFSRSTDEIGVQGFPSGAEITPEGSLYTGFGELTFYLGPDQTPISSDQARIRTLEDGHLPILSYTVHHLGIDYTFTFFAAPVAPQQIALFARVTAHNPGHSPRAAFLTTAIRYQAEQTTETPTGDNRFRRPIPDTSIGQFHQPGEAFSKDWVYSQQANAFLRDGRVLYLFPKTPTQTPTAPRLSYTLRSHYNRTPNLTPRSLDIQPTTPTLAAAYTFVVAPGATQTLDFTLPLIPIQPETPAFAALHSATFDRAHAATVATWRTTLARGMSIELPEPKVTDTFEASLVYDLLALYQLDGQSVQTVNDFQYHRFYLRDAADFVRMYDATGYPDLAAQVLSFFASRQQPDGNFLSQPGQFDGWGEALWAFGEHFRRTHSLAFATAVYPSIVRAVDWLIQARAADPLHLMPKSDVRDNEYVAAHLTSYNFLALGGLQSAIELAQATGHPEDATRFQREYDDYHRQFFTLLDLAAARDHGYIPPALDAVGYQGTDWGNLLSVTPVQLLDPHDPRVTATLERTQSRYQEGITTYTEPDDGQFLHHYLTIKNTLTELIRGDQQQAIQELYALLLHTSSTHAGFEYAIRPWGSRDFEGNLAPHGWFAADYRNLLRNMMLREEGDQLHLLSALSPEWVGAGKTIHIQRAPSTFGTTDFTLTEPTATTATLRVTSQWYHAPQAIVLHLPWFMRTTRVTADGTILPITTGTIQLPASTRVVQIRWHRIPSAPRLNYRTAVTTYTTEYQRRYTQLLNTGHEGTSD